MFLRFLVARGGIEPPTLRMNDPLPTDRYWLVIDHPSELIPAGRVRPKAGDKRKTTRRWFKCFLVAWGGIEPGPEQKIFHTNVKDQ